MADHLESANPSKKNATELLQDSCMELIYFLSTHPSELQMVTHSQKGIIKPNHKYALIGSYSPMKERKCLDDAPNSPSWLKVIDEEVRALKHNNTWSLVPQNLDMTLVRSKWV